MKWLLSIILLTYTPIALAEEKLASKPKVKKPDCYCTDKVGARVELGTMVCMKVGGRDFIARCEMSLNNPMWREISQGCMSSSNQTLDNSNPLADAPLVDT
jgi:hypothetical protein